MANVPLDRIISTVTARLPGTVAPAVQLEMFSVLDEFLQDSLVWTDDATLSIKPDVLNYNVAVTAGQMIMLQEVVDADGVAVAALMPTPGNITLGVTPSQVAKYTATFILTVTDPISRDAYPIVPNWIATRYNGVLLDGVLGHLLGQSNKPYSDETRAVYHLRRFRNGIGKARSDAARANTVGAQNWSFPQTFAVRRPRP